MIILDTCILIFDALTPDKLTPLAKKTILSAEKKQQLFCCDISLWEIAMLIQKKRLQIDMDAKAFIGLLLQARQIQVLNITSDIAVLSTNDGHFKHCDPADRLIAATAISHRAKLITSDQSLRAIPDLSTIW